MSTIFRTLGADTLILFSTLGYHIGLGASVCAILGLSIGVAVGAGISVGVGVDVGAGVGVDTGAVVAYFNICAIWIYHFVVGLP